MLQYVGVNDMNKHIFIGITYASIFGLTFMFSKIGLQSIHPIGLIAFRFTIASIVLLALHVFKVIRITFTKRQLKMLLPLVFFQPILGFSSEMFGIDNSQSSEAGMMIALIPIIVAILSFSFSSEKPTVKQTLSIVLSVSGVIFIQLMNVRTVVNFSMLGALFMFVSAFAAASFNLFSRKLSTSVSPVQITSIMMFTGAIVFMSWYLIILVTSHDISSFFMPFQSFSFVFSVVYLGVIASIIGFFLVNYNLKYLPAHVSSIFANVATLTSIIAGVIFLNEILYWYHMIGALMIISGVMGVILFRRKKAKNQEVYVADVA
jgi:drug/metabolite transporter (DMT)-like permease